MSLLFIDVLFYKFLFNKNFILFKLFLAPILLKEAAKISSASNTSIKLEPAHFEDLFIEQLKKYDSFLSTYNKLSDVQEKVLASISVGEFFVVIYIFFFVYL